MPYSYLTFGQAKQVLAQRLYDATQQFFANAELGDYIIEGLQSFNALGNFYRQEFVFDGQFATTWYDLTAQTGTLRALTTTDQNLLNLIEYHLLEPQTATYPLVWTGSKQFAISDLLNAIQQSRDQLLSESGCTVLESLINATKGRIFLQDQVIDLRRVCWIPGSIGGSGSGGCGLTLVFMLNLGGKTGPTNLLGFTTNCLMSSDLWGVQSFEAGFPQSAPGTPLTFRRSTSPPLSFDVDIQPAVPGQYDVLTVNAGATLSTNFATVLPVPNDWCWVAKWGALAQLMGRESAASDPTRAQYALYRYQQGLAAMRAAPALLGGRINDVPVTVEAVTAADFYRANWQGLTPGKPDSIYYSGLNMVALAPAPDANGPYSVTATVIANMPLPEADTDNIQIGRDDLSAVLDYAQHIAMFKVGGAEFMATYTLLKNFMRQCALYNSKLSALSPFLEFLDGRSREDERLNPVFGQPDPATVEAKHG